MSRSVFQFKRFSVCDEQATMKVGTDAVLLGAWANISNATNLLDIGTGSGVIALMLAQRSADHAHIDAIELQAEDAQQAIENVKLSPWLKKISVIHTSLQAFDTNRQYDVIVCNPPYFSKSLLPPKDARAITRHDETLSAIDLIQAAKNLLTPGGVLNIILPCQEALQFSILALSHDLYLARHTRFYSRATKPPERSLMEFSRIHSPVIGNDLVLYSENNEWTTDYSRLTGDFYLDRPTRLSKNS